MPSCFLFLNAKIGFLWSRQDHLKPLRVSPWSIIWKSQLKISRCRYFLLDWSEIRVLGAEHLRCLFKEQSSQTSGLLVVKFNNANLSHQFSISKSIPSHNISYIWHTGLWQCRWLRDCMKKGTAMQLLWHALMDRLCNNTERNAELFLCSEPSSVAQLIN